MRSSFLPVAFTLFASTVGCSVTTSPEEGVPTFTADEVRPSIEGTWNGTITEGGSQKPLKLTLKYVKGGVTTQCSNRTLNEPGALRINCVDVSTLNLEGDIALNGQITVVNGSFMIMESKFQNRGEVSLQSPAKTTTRLDAMLANGKLEGSLTLEEGKSITIALAR